MIKLYINCICLKITYILLFSVGMLCALSCQAQQQGTGIKGQLVNEKGTPITSGTVYLLKASDSSIVKLALINDLGQFDFDKLREGVFLIGISVMGYQKRTLSLIKLRENSYIDVGVVTLKKDNDLKELQIEAQTNYVDIKPGKVILNVSKSVLSPGNTALDILATAPGVQVGDNGNITLRGKDVMVMMDGKQVYLAPDALADLLRSTPGSSISQIELISSANAGYSAAGSGGIINIKRLRNKTEGISVAANGAFGITDINAQYGTRSKWSSGFNLDYNTKNISLFGGFTHADNIFQRLSLTNRAVYNPSLKQIQTDYLNDLNDRANNLRLGMDYNISPKQVIGFLVTGIYSNYDYTKNTTTTTNVNGSPDSMFVDRSLTTRRLWNYFINLNYKGSLGKLGELSVDADYSVYDRKPFETIYTDKYVLHPVITKVNVAPPSYIQNTFPTLYHIYSFTANDNIKLNSKSWLLAAGKVSYVTNDNTADFGNVTNGVYQADPRFTGIYNYNEQINEFGLTYNTALSKKTNLEVGLRAEQTITQGKAISSSMVLPGTTNNYVDYFPSVQLTSNLSDNDQFSFSFSRRIKRPAYNDLNPFVNYQDQYNYYEGNPDLKPQYTNTIEVTNIFKQKFSATLHASISTNYVFITFLPSNIIAQKVNFGNNNSYGIQLNQVIDVTRWWNANINLDASLEHYDNSLNGTAANIDGQQLTLAIHQQFSFLNNYKAELLTTYEAPHYDSFYHYDERYRATAGVSRSIFNKKGSVQFQVLDIFNSFYNNYTTNYQGLNYSGHAQNSFRTYQISLTYSFANKGNKAERQHKLGSSDEQNRAGGGG